MNNIFDVAVIGGGPGGLFASFECGLMGLSCVLIESTETLGGQCNALYPEKEILDIPASPAVLARDLITSLIQQEKHFNCVKLLNNKVLSLNEKSDDEQRLWVLKTDKQKEVLVKSVIIASGGGSFKFNKIFVPESEDFEDKSIFYSVQDKSKFAGKIVSIIGGGDAAIDWTMALSESVKKINLIHRRETFKAAPSSLSRIKELLDCGKIEIFTPYNLVSLSGNQGVLDAIKIIKNSHEGETLEETIKSDFLLAFLGLAPTKNHFSEWGLDVVKNKISVDRANCLTNLVNVYAIGDVATYDGKITSIISAFSEGAVVARNIQKILYPDQKIPLHRH